MNSSRIYGKKVWLLLLVRAAVWTQSLSLSFFLVLHSICAPTFHPHIKAIHHQDQNHCVGSRQPDLLVGFFCVCEFYDWGQGPGTHRYISDKVSLWLTPSLPLSTHSLFFAQISQCELQGHMLMSLLKQTSEFERTHTHTYVGENQLPQRSGTGKTQLNSSKILLVKVWNLEYCS